MPLSGGATPSASTTGPLAAQRDEALQRGDTARAETLDRDPEIHLGRSAWMMARTDEDNARTERNDRIVEGNRDREQERAAGHEAIRTIQEQIQALIRRGIEKVKETVKGLVRGPQPDPRHVGRAAAAREAAAAAARA